MLLSRSFYATYNSLALASAGVACLNLSKQGKHADGPSVGLLMVKKSKKRNPT